METAILISKKELKELIHDMEWMHGFLYNLRYPEQKERKKMIALKIEELKEQHSKLID
jgi:hypothetical protein